MSIDIPNIPTWTDVVFLDNIHLAATIGPDSWGREREQPIDISVYLHLKNSYLQAAGVSDNVVDSVHYGHLSKTVSSMVEEKGKSENPAFTGVDELILSVAQRAFELAGGAAVEVKVTMDMPRMVQLASGFFVEATISSASPHVLASKKVSVKDLILPVLIGVNPPERRAKQRVIASVTFYEDVQSTSLQDYRTVIAKLCEEMLLSEYLTLEKFVMEVVRTACVSSSDRVLAVTVKTQKQTALVFTQYSGVEITRTRAAFL